MVVSLFLVPTDLRIIVETLSGETFELDDIKETDTIDSVRTRIQGEIGVPPCQQQLVFAGDELEDGRTVSDYNIQKESIVYLARRLRGGIPGPRTARTSTSFFFPSLEREEWD